MAHQLHTIEGIFDGENIYQLVEIKTKRKYRVIITFLESIDKFNDFKDLKLHSEKVFEKLWEDENDAIWSTYL